MIKASYLQKQGMKYRELARAEISLEMRRQLFALAARCDEIAATIARWPLPNSVERTLAPQKPKRPKNDNAAVGATAGAAAPLPFPNPIRGRVVHRLDS